MKKILLRNAVEIDATIQLLPYSEKYHLDFFHLVMKNLSRLQNHFPVLTNKIESEESTKLYFQEKNKNWNSNLEYAYLILFDEKVIGHFNIKNLNWKNNSAEFSYWIDVDFENKGIVSKIIKNRIQFLFNELNIDKIYAMCDIDNKASEKVMIKSGMQYEGTIHKNYKTQQNISIDTYLYSIERRN